MQSNVSQVRHTSISFTFTSSGESVDAVKLNWPIGQTYLQKGACLKVASTTRAAAKNPTMSQAVAAGQRPQIQELVGEEHEDEEPIASHLPRRRRGQRGWGGRGGARGRGGG